MSVPIVPGRAGLPPSPQNRRGDNALTAPTSPGKRLMPAVDRSQVDPQVRQAAEGMEAMFLDYMMKVMRDTIPENEMSMDNPATKIYQGMMDSEMAQKAARTGGIGLADQVIAYLESQRYTLPKGQAAPVAGNSAAASTGGTHEGQPVRK